MRASSFTNKFDNQPDTFDCTWEGLVDWWRDLSEEPRSPAEKDGDDALGVRASCPAICPAEYGEGERRRKVNVLRWHFFACDIDNDDPEAMLSKDDAVALMQHWGLGYVIHSSTKSRPHQHRYRLIFKLSRPIEAEEYDRVWASINLKFANIFDVKTRDPSRLFFVPAKWEGSFWFFETGEGGGLDVDQVLVDHPVEIEVAKVYEALPAPKLVQAVGKVAEIRAKLLGADTWADVTDPFRSPFVTERMRSKYQTAIKGGRFYSFMVSVAGSALGKGYPITAEELETLALAMDRSIGGGRRTNSLHEARRALSYAVQHFSDRTEQRRQLMSRFKGKWAK